MPGGINVTVLLGSKAPAYRDPLHSMRAVACRVVLALLMLTGCVPHRDPMIGQQPGLMRASDLPSLDGWHYKVDPYIRAAVGIQELDRKAAIDRLVTIARDPTCNDRVVPLCRMLFVKRAGGEFRGARLGCPEQLGYTTDESPWPLEPIEIVDGVPFLITNGYNLGGEPESGESYLRYCLANCDWTTARFAPKSLSEKTRAAHKLSASPRWRYPTEVLAALLEQIQ
jgi:hypothetical protein